MSSDFKEVANEVVGMEGNKIWSTIKNLTLRPGLTIKRFCSGEKNLLIPPGTYLFATMAITYYLASATGYENDVKIQTRKQVSEMVESAKTDDEKHAIQKAQKLGNKYEEKIQEFIQGETGQKILILPIALLLRWLLFRRYVKGFKDNSWYALFTMGHIGLLGTPLFILVYFLTNNLYAISLVGLLLLLSYDTWASKTFYGIKLSTALALNFLFILTYFFAIGLLGFLTGLIFGGM